MMRTDVIAETYLAAYNSFPKLKSRELFKPWILAIARNQCNLWYRGKYGADHIPLEQIAETEASTTDSVADGVKEILDKMPRDLGDVLRLTMDGYAQREIAEMIGIPIGTVKSRMHHAKKQFRSLCTSEELEIFEKGRKKMTKKDPTCGFPAVMPELTISKTDKQFFEVKCAEGNFIIPVIGNRNSEGTYRYPDKKLACVSTCYVPKAAIIHEVPGVKVCRDTYNVREGKLYKNEAIWFSQLTDEYIRDLGGIAGDADDEYPTEIYTFLEEDYDIAVNGKDRVHGRPLLITENPLTVVDGVIRAEEYGVRYTTGVFDVTIGERTFECVGFIIVANGSYATESYVDRNGRLVMLRWYESVGCLDGDIARKTAENPKINVNGTEYRLIEDRIGEYAL